MSGAEGRDSGAVEGSRTPPGVVTIRCRENGPLVVEMPVVPGGGLQALRVTDHEGREFVIPDQKRAVALCRCGHSGTRPFCDGAHKKLGPWAAELADDAARTPDDPSG
jgi:CDGSH-type Zn-finger protein